MCTQRHIHRHTDAGTDSLTDGQDPTDPRPRLATYQTGLYEVRGDAEEETQERYRGRVEGYGSRMGSTWDMSTVQ